MKVMPILRNGEVSTCIPRDDGSLRTEFVCVSVKEGKREIKDATGKVVSTESFSVPSFDVIPSDVFIHKGETCEMYSLQNLMKAGISLSPVTTPYESATLEQRSDIQSRMNDSQSIECDLDKLDDRVNVHSDSQQTIKFD